MTTAADKITRAILDGITDNLKLTGGTMPIRMVLPDVATAIVNRIEFKYVGPGQ